MAGESWGHTEFIKYVANELNDSIKKFFWSLRMFVVIYSLLASSMKLIFYTTSLADSAKFVRI